jgi:hypothetical protein
MDTFLWIASLMNVIAGAVSIFTIVYAMHRFRPEISGMAVPLIFSICIEFYFIGIYMLNLLGYVTNLETPLYLRAPQSLVLLLPGLIAFSQVLWNRRRNES